MINSIFKIYLLGTVVVLFFLLTVPVSAHVFGQPPYFKINGQYSNLYPVPLTSFADFNLPQDLAPQNYLVGQKLSFELDENRLPAPPEIVEKTNFTWDFGDGGTGTGLKNSHTYSKMGSYILDIYADDGTTPTPQLLEKALINILPDKNYKLPKSVILINGRGSKDPLTDILVDDFNQTFNFDATHSESGSERIVSYFWDFGDQKSSVSAIATHAYLKDTPQIFPVLRIKDSNGFISDAFIEIKNEKFAGNTLFAKPSAKIGKSQTKNIRSQLKYSLLSIIVFVLGFLIIRRLRKK